MYRVVKHPVFIAMAALFMVFMLVAGGFALYLGGQAGVLPWQTDPTRIPITPFADIPGFIMPTSQATVALEATPTP